MIQISYISCTSVRHNPFTVFHNPGRVLGSGSLLFSPVRIQAFATGFGSKYRVYGVQGSIPLCLPYSYLTAQPQDKEQRLIKSGSNMIIDIVRKIWIRHYNWLKCGSKPGSIFITYILLFMYNTTTRQNAVTKQNTEAQFVASRSSSIVDQMWLKTEIQGRQK